MLRHAWILLIILLAPPALAENRPPAAAIASAHPLATEAGFEILEAGGNAFDAAIAVGAVLAVVEPAGSGMGGGGFWLLHRQHDGLQTMLDAREAAPAAASTTMYQDEDGNVVRDLAINGPLAAGIPGQAAAFVHLAEHYGRVPLARSLAPAVRLAREGFPVSERYRTLIGFRDEVLTRYPAASCIFLKDGEVPPAGHVIRQPDLARVLERIARDGNAGFYEGETARDLVRGVRAAGGLWTHQDLADYTIKERAPIVSEFRGARIVSAPPPSSGGIVLAETLNILAQFNDGDIAPELLPHLTVEAMKRAYRDRAEHLGDPDFVSMPVTRLLSVQHARELARGISLDRPTPSSELGTPLAQPTGCLLYTSPSPRD